MFQTIRCPGGITEKDITTFFAQYYPSSFSNRQSRETTRALKIFSHINSEKLENATLIIVCSWGFLHFTSGDARRTFTVEINGKIVVNKFDWLID
jgi:hypothetical protein